MMALSLKIRPLFQNSIEKFQLTFEKICMIYYCFLTSDQIVNNYYSLYIVYLCKNLEKHEVVDLRNGY